MKRVTRLTCVLLLCHYLPASAQINFTANDFSKFPVYKNYFQYGTNMGYYGNSWNDKALADIAAGNSAKKVPGAGVKTMRLSLPENFVEPWGYDIRLSEFSYYGSLGIKDNTVFLGQPTPAHREATHYNGCVNQSSLFSNMYTPIWDGGANGTPVNDKNYFALYVYKIVTRYKTQTKFWEIVNEPDYTSTSNGSLNPGQTGNWWDNNPKPCHLTNLNAPIFNYVRLLRIAYEVIKYVDPTALVAPGGLGFPSFLDAILRNTDNPADGSVTTEYPKKGGAYFDVMSFHCYPMYALQYWDNSINGFAYTRHSDAAVDKYIALKKQFETVLFKYGYNGKTYPLKYFICTENNLPRKQIGQTIGSNEAQKNYILKALVASQKNNISQFYTFVLGDSKTLAEATTPHQTMGLYQKLDAIGPLTNGGKYQQKYSDEGIAYKTASDLLRYYRYDSVRTNALNLPATVDGGAFKDSIGTYVYVLWARTKTDQSESASATYSFPAAAFVAPTMFKRQWSYSTTGASSSIPSVNIALTGTPVFLSDIQLVPLRTQDPHTSATVDRQFEVSVYPNPAAKQATLGFTLREPARIEVDIYDAAGKWIRKALPTSSFTTGTHEVELQGIDKLPAGVYYCRFQTEILQVVKKLIISR